MIAPGTLLLLCSITRGYSMCVSIGNTSTAAARALHSSSRTILAETIGCMAYDESGNTMGYAVSAQWKP